jgi:hypothetical protein
MRHDPTAGELLEHEVATESHRLVLEWLGTLAPLRSRYFAHEARALIGEFAEWLLTRRPPTGNVLRDLAERLTPNPARTVEGTLAVLLDGIDKLDDEWLARALAHVNARTEGLDAAPLTDEQWKAGDIHSKVALLRAARSLKQALREASKL